MSCLLLTEMSVLSPCCANQNWTILFWPDKVQKLMMCCQYKVTMTSH